MFYAADLTMVVFMSVINADSCAMLSTYQDYFHNVVQDVTSHGRPIRQPYKTDIEISHPYSTGFAHWTLNQSDNILLITHVNLYMGTKTKPI